MFDICISLLILLQFHGYFLHVLNVNETELKLAFIVHRHGEKTPQKEALSLSNNPEELKKLSQPYGYGELTKRGIETGYKLGQFIRRRYGRLLHHAYRPWEHYVRTTFSPRTVTTAVVSLAGAYFVDLGSWTDVLKWIPLPYYTVIAKYDYNTALLNCPTLMNMEIIKTRFPEMDQYLGLFKELSDIVPFNLTKYPLLIYAVYDLYVIQTHLGMPLSELQQKLLSRIKEATDTATDVFCGNENAIGLLAGVLLSEFIKSASNSIAGFFTHRVQQYSAHDFNVYAFEATTRVTPRQGYPEFGSLLSLELRWDKRCDKYYVLPVYVSSPGQEEKYLNIKGCGDSPMCEFQKFVDLTANNSMDIETWKQKCRFREDMHINIYTLE